MNSDILIAIITASSATFLAGIFGLITTLLNQRSNRKNKQSDDFGGLTSGVSALLQIHIKHLCDDAIAAQKISLKDLQDILRFHDIYKEAPFYGNGYLDEIIGIVRKLPVIPD